MSQARDWKGMVIREWIGNRVLKVMQVVLGRTQPKDPRTKSDTTLGSDQFPL